MEQAQVIRHYSPGLKIYIVTMGDCEPRIYGVVQETTSSWEREQGII
jgi:hypothetical protein